MDWHNALRPFLIIGTALFGFLAVASLLRFWLGIDATVSGVVGLLAGILCGVGMASAFWDD